MTISNPNQLLSLLRDLLHEPSLEAEELLEILGQWHKDKLPDVAFRYLKGHLKHHESFPHLLRRLDWLGYKEEQKPFHLTILRDAPGTERHLRLVETALDDLETRLVKLYTQSLQQVLEEHNLDTSCASFVIENARESIRTDPKLHEDFRRYFRYWFLFLKQIRKEFLAHGIYMNLDANDFPDSLFEGRNDIYPAPWPFDGAHHYPLIRWTGVCLLVRSPKEIKTPHLNSLIQINELEEEEYA